MLNNSMVYGSSLAFNEVWDLQFIADEDQVKVAGYEDITSEKSTDLLDAADVYQNTYIIRPSPRLDCVGSYVLDVKGEKEVYRFVLKKINNEFLFTSQIRAHSITDLIHEIKKMDFLPTTHIRGDSLVPYNSK
ncbi:MAG: hypothetical protein H0T62_08880 [Parachlamydiaceae bacterium]|nr:hypothetical protein [Parachlamydiaceae bacterium]